MPSDWCTIDAAMHGSGKRFVTTLSLALQYLLPFDDAESSPLRAAGRVHLVVPTRFTTEVCARAKKESAKGAACGGQAHLCRGGGLD